MDSVRLLFFVRVCEVWRGTEVVGWIWKKLGGRGKYGKYDQNPLYEILRELIKILYLNKEVVSCAEQGAV